MGQFSVTIYGATGSVLNDSQQLHYRWCPTACRRLLWESLGAKRRVHCACSGTNHWLVGKHIWEVWAFSCPFCVRVSLHSLLDAIGITRLGLTVSGLFLTGVVLKAVPKVVPYRVHDPVFITFLELIGS